MTDRWNNHAHRPNCICHEWGKRPDAGTSRGYSLTPQALQVLGAPVVPQVPATPLRRLLAVGFTPEQAHALEAGGYDVGYVSAAAVLGAVS